MVDDLDVLLAQADAVTGTATASPGDDLDRLLAQADAVTEQLPEWARGGEEVPIGLAMQEPPAQGVGPFSLPIRQDVLRSGLRAGNTPEQVADPIAALKRTQSEVPPAQPPGALEWMGRKAPWLGSLVAAAESTDFALTMQRINENKATPADYERAARWLNEQKRKSEFSTREKIIDVATDLPRMAIEFGATRPIQSAVAGGVSKFIPGAMHRATGEVIAGTVGAAAQGLAQPMFAEATARQLANQSLEGRNLDFAEAAGKGALESAIQTATEYTGGAFSNIPIPKQVEAIREAISRRWIGAAAGRTAKEFGKKLEEVGWNGILGEMFEERVADAAMHATGLQDSAVPTWEQIGIEAAAFSLPGATQMAAGVALNAQDKISSRGIRMEVATMAVQTNPEIAKAIAEIENPSRSEIADALGVEEKRVRLSRGEREQLYKMAREAAAYTGADRKTYYTDINEAVRASDPNAAKESQPAATPVEAVAPPISEVQPNEEVQAQGQGNQEGLLAQPNQPAEAVSEPGALPPQDTPTGNAPPPQAESERLIGIYNDKVDEQRKERGQSPIMAKLKMSDQESWDRAMSELGKDPLAGTKLVDSILADARPTRKWETALMLHQKAVLVTQHGSKLKEYEDAVASGSLEAQAQVQKQLDLTRQSLDKLDKALRDSGSESGLSLQGRQMMLLLSEDNFTLTNMQREGRVAAGRELTPAENQQFADLSKRYEELAKRLADIEASAEERAAATAADAAIVEVRKTARKAGKTKDEAKARIKTAWAEFEKAAAGKLFSTVPDAETIKAAAGLVKAYVDLGVVSFRDFMRRVTKEFGDKATKAQAALQAAWNAHHAGDTRSLVDRMGIEADESDPGSMGRLVAKLAEEFVASGITDRDKVVDVIHAELKDIDETITRRQTMDLLSQYGKFKQLDKDPIKKEVRRIRGELQQVAKLEDIEAKKPLLKTGIERREVGDEERRLIQQVNEAKRKHGVVVTDPAKQLASALGALKKRFQNQIKDLQHQIDTKAKIVKSKTPIAKDAEATALEAERDRLKAEFDSIFGRKKISDAQRIANAIKATERSIAEYERKLATGDIAAKKKTSQTPETPQLDALRARRDALRDQVEELRKLAKPKKSAEEIALAALKTRMRNRISELLTKIEKKDFGPKPKKPPIPRDAEATALEFQLEKVKRQTFDAYKKLRNENRHWLLKGYDFSKNLQNTARGIVTSLDFSAVMRQGGALVLSTPSLLKNTKDMFRAMASEGAEFEIAKKIAAKENSKNGLYKKGGLYLAGEEKLQRMEEAYLSPWTKNIPLVAGSERAYVTFLNLIRSEKFDALVGALGGPDGITLAEAKIIANYVNVATGRGNFGKYDYHASALSNVFFAPKYTVSRFQLLLGQPMLSQIGKGSWRVRKLIAKEYAKVLIGTGVFLGSAMLALKAISQASGGSDEPEIELDPRSSDFLKLKIGNTRIDALYGLSQSTVLLARGATRSTKTHKGEILPLTGPDVAFGKADLGDVLFRFGRSKLAPLPATAWNWWTGEGYGGEPYDETSVIRDQVPLSLRDIYDSLKENGIPAGTAIGLVSLFGLSVQTYGQRTPQEKMKIREQAYKDLTADPPEIKEDDTAEKYQRRVRMWRMNYDNAVRILNTVK